MSAVLDKKEVKKQKKNKEDKLDGMVVEKGYGIIHGYTSLTETLKNIHEYKKTGKKKK